MAYNNNILFEVLGNILQKKSEEIFVKHISADDFEKQFSRYMVIRYLSMANKDVARIILDNQIQLERFPTNKTVYRFLMNVVPKQKSGFIKYIK